MLNTNRTYPDWKDRVQRAPATPEYDFRWMIQSLYRFRLSIIALMVIFGGLASVYVLQREPTYTASALLQLTNLRLNFNREDAFFAETQTDPNFLETQIQLLRSARVALSVVDNLKLADREAPDAGFSPADMLRDLLRNLRPGAADEQSVVPGVSDARFNALKMVQRGFKADRIGLSNVVQIEFTSDDPVEAARILNEYANAYIMDQNAARVEAAQSASSWLRERLRDVGPKTRVIAPALPPTDKSNPSGRLIVIFSAFLGAGAGMMLALLRAYFDKRIRSPLQAAAATLAECLGVTPLVKVAKTRNAPDMLDHQARRFSIASQLLSYAVTHPKSVFGRTITNLRVASDECFDGKGLQVIGITSTFDREGKTTIAANLALNMATAGRRVLLVDANPSAGSLSQILGLDGQPGLTDCLGGKSDQVAGFVWHHGDTNTAVLPFGSNARVANALIWTDAMGHLIETLRPFYDSIIFDLSPLAAIGDVRASSRYVDGFVLVLRAEEVTSDQVTAALGIAGGVYDRLLGSIINGVKMSGSRWMAPPDLALIRRLHKSNRIR
jgi:succinoglycan biosynthesis transport protein ExoP